MHVIDPFKRGSGDSSVSPNGGSEMMQQLKVEVVGFGGWEVVQSVKVEGKNAEAEFEYVRVFNGLIGDT